MEFTSKRYPSFQFKFGHVNVILGANGAGKSQVLRDIRDEFNNSAPGSVVYIEGGRTIAIADVINLDAKNFSRYDKLETAENIYATKRVSSLADRVYDLLVVLEKREQKLKSDHSDRAEAWALGTREGAYPARPPTPLTRLFGLFNEIFPQLRLTFDHSARRLSVEKGGTVYGPSGLSDGEKQVFSILADLIELEEKHALIIADEPELNLHPELAERLWTLLESEFPTRTFIYATHSISFALRSGVDSVFVLSGTPQEVVEFSDLKSLPRDQTVALLGALPGILSANRVVVTEGHEKSFDAIFYRWLLGDEKLEVYPAGSCADVVDVATKTGLWDRISSRVSICGAIDLDFRSAEQAAAAGEDPLVCLEFHEAESYLCLPAVASALGKKIGSQAVLLEIEDVEELILRELEARQLAVAARRVMCKAKITLGVSIEKRAISGLTDRIELLTKLRAAAEIELEKAGSTVGPDRMEAFVNEELQHVADVLASRDVRRSLQLLPGKQLAASLAPRIGCKNPDDMMRALRANFSASDFPETKSLSENLLARCG